MNRDRGGYVGVTSYLDYPSVGFTGSYSVYGADKVILYQDYPYERQVYDYENNVTLLKVLAGFRISGFRLAEDGFHYGIQLRAHQGPTLSPVLLWQSLLRRRCHQGSS
ncbi:MAG TPA: hypothetical protein GXZ82_13205 [Firmicutes bacterium]|nr:hypothetical protein [Bacillota bacterium]